MAVYFAVDHTGTRVKIGYAGNVAVRFAGLAAMNAHPLSLIAVFEGSCKDEWALHRKFTSRHLHSEWFEFSPDMLADVGLPRREPTEAEKAFEARDRQPWGRKWPEERKREWSDRVRKRIAAKKSQQLDQAAA